MGDNNPMKISEILNKEEISKNRLQSPKFDSSRKSDNTTLDGRPHPNNTGLQVLQNINERLWENPQENVDTSSTRINLEGRPKKEKVNETEELDVYNTMSKIRNIDTELFKNIERLSERSRRESKDVQYWQRIAEAKEKINLVRLRGTTNLTNKELITELAILLKHTETHITHKDMSELRKELTQVIYPIKPEDLMKFLPENMPKRSSRQKGKINPQYDKIITFE